MKKINIDKQTNRDVIIALSILFIPIFGALFNLFFVISSDYKTRALKNLASISSLLFFICIFIVIYYKL